MSFAQITCCNYLGQRVSNLPPAGHIRPANALFAVLGELFEMLKLWIKSCFIHLQHFAPVLAKYSTVKCTKKHLVAGLFLDPLVECLSFLNPSSLMSLF